MWTYCHKDINIPIPHIVIHICEQQHLLELALAIVLNLSTCLRSLFLVESNFPKMQQSKTLRLERKDTA